MTIWKCSFSWSGRSAISTAGLPSIRHDQADGPAGDGVGDEQLLAVDDVVVAVEHGRGPQGGQVGAGARLGQGEAPRAARRWPVAAGSAASARACRRSAPDRPRRCSRGPRPARRPSASIVAIRVRNGANAANGAPCAAVLAGRPAGPSSRPRPARARTGSAILPLSSRACRPRGGGGRRRATRSITCSQPGGVGGGSRLEQLDRELAVPDRAVDRAVARSGTAARRAPRPARRPGRARPSCAPPPRSCRPASARSRQRSGLGLLESFFHRCYSSRDSVSISTAPSPRGARENIPGRGGRRHFGGYHFAHPPTLIVGAERVVRNVRDSQEGKDPPRPSRFPTPTRNPRSNETRT